MDNKKLIEQYIEHLKLGKPILNKKKKPVSEDTAKKILYWLTRISEWIDKDFKEVNQETIDKFRMDLKNDKIRQINKKPYSKGTKRDIEYKIMRPFFQFLGKQDLVLFTDNYKEQSEIPALTREEIEKLANSCNIMYRTLILMIFDLGIRIEELDNILFSDVKDEERKSNGYLKIRIRKSKTKPRTLALVLYSDVLDNWLNVNKDKIGTDKKLFDIKPDAIRHILRKWGKEVLRKNVYPHLIRHSSATYWCKRVNQYQLCKKFGWSMGSNMPQIYIDREGVDLDEMDKKASNEEVMSYQKKFNVIQEELRQNKQTMEEVYQLIIKSGLADKIKKKAEIKSLRGI